MNNTENKNKNKLVFRKLRKLKNMQQLNLEGKYDNINKWCADTKEYIQQ